MKPRAVGSIVLLGCVLVAGVLSSQAVSILPNGAAAAEANCTATQKARNAKALAAFKKQMPKQRAAYFRTHKSPRLRATFVERQRARLAALTKAARCRVVRTTTTGPTTPTARKGPLAPGTYLSSPFSPLFMFTVGPSWFLAFDTGISQMIVAQKSEPGGRAVTIDSFGANRTVAERVAALRSINGIAAEAAVPAMLSGPSGVLRAERFDALTTASDTVLVPGLGARYELEPGDRVRIYVIDVRGSTVTVIIEAPASDWEAFLPLGEQLFSSLDFLSAPPYT